MVKGNASSEDEWTTKLRRRAPAQKNSGLLLGIGDDCAIFRPRRPDVDLLFTTDMLVEGTHFLRNTHRAEDIGWKALARGLSDIAAMGGDARFCLVSLAVARWTDTHWMDGFYRGLLELARRERVALAGGDLSHGDRVACDIVVCGAAPQGKALRRDGARAEDAIFVSGALGGSALGLERGRRSKAWRRHSHPEPRLALGRFLRGLAGVTSAMDLSDGLSLDLGRMCLASKLAAEIEAPPRYPGATLEQALHGGEDYELLFTARPGSVPGDFAGLPLTQIGSMRKGRAGAITLAGARLAPLGYDHLRQR